MIGRYLIAVESVVKVSLKEKRQVYALIDFMPKLTEAELFALLQKRFKEYAHGKTANEALIGLFNKKLIDVLNRLVENGDSVIIIEHNLDIIKVADYIIDIGPEGGDEGGTIVATGTPEEIVKVKESYTGQFLKKVLGGE